MTEPEPSTKVPLGIPDLDLHLNGGVYPGTTITAFGPQGAGVREFINSAAVMHGNWQAESELFDLAYSEIDTKPRKPSAVHYVSFLTSESQLTRDFRSLVDSEWVEPALDSVTLHGFDDEFAKLGPVRIEGDGSFEYGELSVEGDAVYRQFLRGIGTTFEALLDGSIIIWDGITDLLPVAYRFLDWTDLFFILQTLCHRVARSDSVLIAGANAGFLNHREAALLQRAFQATLTFGWFGEGGYRRRTIEVSEFPEYRQENPKEDRVVFDIEIDRDKFGISNVEKIPPSRLG